MARLPQSNDAVLLAHDANSSEDNPNLLSDEENLSKLVKNIDTQYLSVVSIVGPQKTGKTLLFEHIVKYLTSCERGEIEWIDWSDKKKPIEKINWQTQGLLPESGGIWAFNRPFILQSDNYDKVAILLLYIKTSDKWFWTENKTSAMLTGLGILASSCTVFNVAKQIDDRMLTSIPFCISYAMLGLKERAFQQNQTGFPFQNAVVLLRDWNYPTDYPYGVTRGTEYIQKEKIPERLTQSAESRISRSIWEGSFSNFSGCLLPYPGNDVLKPNYKGTISEMDPLFLETLSDFLSELLDIQNLPLKECIGRQIDGMKWKILFEEYIEKCNSGYGIEQDPNNLMKTIGVNRALLPGEEKQFIKKAILAYTKAWERQIIGIKEKIITDKMLEDCHGSAKAYAIRFLKKETSSGDPATGNPTTLWRQAERDLKEHLEVKFSQYKTIVLEIRKTKIEEVKDQLVNNYRSTCQAVFPKGNLNLRPAVVKRESERIVNGLKQQFLEKIGENRQPHELSPETKIQYDALCRQLDLSEKETVDQFNTKGGSLGQPSRQGESNSLRFNATNMSPAFQHKHSQPERPENKMNFTEAFSPKTIDHEGTFEQAERPFPTGSTTITSRTTAGFNEAEVQNKQTKELVEELKDGHLKKLLEDVGNGVDIEKSNVKHNADVMMDFERKCLYRKEEPLYTLFRKDLEVKMNMSLIQVKATAREQSKLKATKLARIVEDTVSKLKVDLKNVFENPQNEGSKWNDMCTSLVNSAVSKLPSGLANGDHETIGREVRDQCEKICRQMKNDFERKNASSLQHTQSLRTKCEEMYSDIMEKAVKVVSGEDTLKQEHNRAIECAVELLKKDSALPDTAPQIQKLSNEMRDNFNKLYELFRRKLRLRNNATAGNSKLALQEAQHFYDGELERHLRNNEFIVEADLFKIHEDTCNHTWNKFSSQILPDHAKELTTLLENTFQKYKAKNDMNVNVDPAIGIDLGTTFSCVAVYLKGNIKIIPNSIGKLTTPSYVLFQPSGEEIIGESAKERAYENPEGTIFDAKRILGRPFDDPKLQEDMRLWPFSVVDGGRGIPMISVNGEKLNPEVIASKILKELKGDAEKYLKSKVTKAVITVPAYFTDGQKQATVDAGKMAELEVLSILPEPVAAAMAYNLEYTPKLVDGKEEQHILIFDLGGGTFDVAVLETSKGNIEVLTVEGDTHLGGEDFDRNLMIYCAEEFKKKHHIDLLEGKDSADRNVQNDVRRRLKRLQAECERQKIVLAASRSAEVTLDHIYDTMDLKVEVTRATFEKINDALFQKTIQVVEKALVEAKVKKEQIDDVVMVGGSTRIPKIQQMLTQFFGGKQLSKKINPDEAVAHGAGLLAAIKRGNVSKESAAFTKIQNITPMPIGVEVYGGAFSVIIPKSTKIPVKLIEKYKTAHNNQTSVQITIYEGEEKVAVKNKHLGDFYLNGIPPRNAGVEEIHVEMDINDQGILHVTAKCGNATTKKAINVLENKQRMGRATIDRYIGDKKR